MTFKDISIGRGEKMSVAKAALIFYFEEFDGSLLTYGHLDEMGRIVAIAGAKQKSFFTPAQVTARLRASAFWDKKISIGHYRGTRRGRGDALIFQPSEKGRIYYDSFLRCR